MAKQEPAELCPDDRVRALLDAARIDPDQALPLLSRAGDEFPSDPRLRFLIGSFLAGDGRYTDARSEMREALRIDPSYAIARFQLGLLELTSGDAAAAELTWRPLDDLPPDDALRVFSERMRSLARDDFDGAVGLLERGIALNCEHTALSNDMNMLIQAIRAHRASGAPTVQETSAAHMLLQQYKPGPTKH